MSRFFMILLFLMCGMLGFQHKALSTHNRAGEITYKQTGPLTIEMTIVTYTKASSVAADRDSLEVFWGDGSFEQVIRDNSRTEFDVNDIKINYYIASHTYPGIATYTISFLDPNRVGGILNVNFPNSIDIPFFLSTTFTLLDPQFQGFNNSVVLLQPPIDIGCVDRVFIHNPNAYDSDGDSLVFELVEPLQGLNTPVPNYRLPDEIGQFSDNVLTINRFTGEIVWRTPKIQGDYNIAIKVKEYRNGRLINELLRDMQVLIRACENDPPIIRSEEEFCVVAGTSLVIPLDITDPNAGQRVRLTATGGPFIVSSPATIDVDDSFREVPFNGQILWNTTCDHISDQYYQIVLRAADNFFPDSTGLATLKTIRIKVVGPPPQNLISYTENDDIRLEWDAPYVCENGEKEHFRGFSVWRKISSSNYEPDTCQPGLSHSPYTRIRNITRSLLNDSYTFLDTTAEMGNTYCYRVQAEFALLTAFNNPFNRVESLPSNETCILKNRDLPLLTKVSVSETDISAGKMELRWTKPLIQQYDTTQFLPPYRYILQRADTSGFFQTIWTEEIPYFQSDIDTFFVDTVLNTRESPYTYNVQLASGNGFLSVSPQASSVFLDIVPGDERNILSWRSSVPWNNVSYDIFREDENGNFILIGNTNSTLWEDTGLDNGVRYCYKILATGTYAIEHIEDPLFNFSQIHCQVPFDNRAPCPPEITAKNVCDKLSENITVNELYNTIQWTSPETLCPDVSEDLMVLHIYFSPTLSGTYNIIQTISKDAEEVFLHYPEDGLSGCYYMTSVDTNGNESAPSEVVCLENCPFYKLPNTFTPNGDGRNDLFRPLVNIFINSIDLKIFNLWGNLVYETSDPAINWDGRSSRGSELPDGTYYYKCQVFEQTITGIQPNDSILSGHINIIRN